MTNEEVIVREPNVGFDARTSGRERVVQRYFAPVIIVRMARDWGDVAAEIRGIMCFCLRRRVR